jgi:REP-associated tyrosine transposase
MDERESLNRTQWECKYHVISIPKYRRKALYKELRRYLREVFRRLAGALCRQSGGLAVRLFFN